MLRRGIVSLVAVVGIGAGSAGAQPRPPINPMPFSHAACSQTDARPCTPAFCSAFDAGSCIVEIAYGQVLQVTVETVPPKGEEARYRKPEHDLDTIGHLFAALRSCWSPPPAETAREGMQMSVSVSFRRSGEIIGPPRLTYATPGVSTDVRTTYLKAIDASLQACQPLKFTSGLGGALAGRPIAIRYIDNRKLGKQEKP